jgi:hypothetical protein
MRHKFGAHLLGGHHRLARQGSRGQRHEQGKRRREVPQQGERGAEHRRLEWIQGG